MDLTKITLFSNHTTTGSIYNTPVYDTENARRIRFWFQGPIKAGLGGSATIWFNHGDYPGSRMEVYPGLIVLGAGGATLSNMSLRNSFNLLSAATTTGSMATGFFYPEFIPNCVQCQYEISGVAGSASAGTIGAFLAIERDIVS